MGQKVNPIGFRLGVTKNWASIWNGNNQNYIQTVYRDLRIREYVINRLSKLGYIVGHCVIKRLNHQIYVNIQVLTTKSNHTQNTNAGSGYIQVFRSSKDKHNKGRLSKSVGSLTREFNGIKPASTNKTLQLDFKKLLTKHSIGTTKPHAKNNSILNWNNRLIIISNKLNPTIRTQSKNLSPLATSELLKASSKAESLPSAVAASINQNVELRSKYKIIKLLNKLQSNNASLLTLEKLKNCTFNNLRAYSKKQRKQAIIYLITRQLELFEGLIKSNPRTNTPTSLNCINLHELKALLNIHKPVQQLNITNPAQGIVGFVSPSWSFLDYNNRFKDSKITPSKTFAALPTLFAHKLKTAVKNQQLKDNPEPMAIPSSTPTVTLRTRRNPELCSVGNLARVASPIIVKISNARLFNQPFIAQGIANYLAKTIYKRKSVSFALKPIMKLIDNSPSKNLGLRVKYSGRINGVEMARSSQIKIGRVPLQSIAVKIDYAIARVYTIFGVIGVKVWVNKKNF